MQLLAPNQNVRFRHTTPTQPSRHQPNSDLKQPQTPRPRLDLVGRNVPLGGESGPVAERLDGSLDDLLRLSDVVLVAEGNQFLDGEVIRLAGDRHLMLQRVSIARGERQVIGR